ncbi:MAG: peptidoglycan DD-metalloendopeptidase family protein [Candidatus Woesearchaeota archaeon]|nr:peptidoglycan DD-metalloendopeptidase family protein [Candidatus Woesearchaeota archaeon]
MIPQTPAPVVKGDLEQAHIFDLTSENKEFEQINLADTNALCGYFEEKLKQTRVGIGRYNENRTIYARSPLFAGRTVHLGIDIFAPTGTPVYAPLDGKIHSFQNNAHFGDYGPTIILQHEEFFTLYGHLSTDSLQGIEEGQTILAGQQIGKMGNTEENGNWPPHLHFQIITDMQGKKGDYPGVASIQDREKYLKLCPDPNIILKMKQL